MSEKYFEPLKRCAREFVTKEASAALVILGGLVKFWPDLSPTKQVLFIQEIMDIIGVLVGDLGEEQDNTSQFDYNQYKDILVE